MIKVTIKDADALKAITVQQLKDYLSMAGWYKKEDLHRITHAGEKNIVGEIWSQDVGPVAKTAIVVPARESFADYTARLSEAMMALEKAEGRSQIEIYVDITKKPIVIRPKKSKKSRKKDA